MTFISITIEEKKSADRHRADVMVGAKDGKLKQWTVTDPRPMTPPLPVYKVWILRRSIPLVPDRTFTESSIPARAEAFSIT